MKMRHFYLVMLGILLVVLTGTGRVLSLPGVATVVASLAGPDSDAEGKDFVSGNTVQATGDMPVADNRYRRVEFTTDGVRFAPREDGALVPGHDVTYRLLEVRSGRQLYLSLGEGLATTSTRPLVSDNQVSYAHPAGVTERYVVDDQSVEQLFVFDQPLTLDGDLQVVGQFETTLTPLLEDPLKGVHFLDDGVDVLLYSGAIVFDAAGRQAPAPLNLDGKRVTITVPGDWLAEATYPVTIDPRLEGGRINIGYLSLNQERPAVAYSTASGQYLAVFESSSGEGNILGRFVDGDTGQVLGSFFYVADGSTSERDPDVAYDPYRDRFLVVWEEYYCAPVVPTTCNYVIKGRLVYGAYQSEDYFPGDAVTVASQWSNITAGYDLRDPAVAYNAQDHEFAVIFKRGQESTSYSDVYGQMLSSSSTEPTLLGSSDGFEIRSYGSWTILTPDVAWGSDGSTFLAAWEVERDSDVDYVAVGYLYDTYQGGGSQVLKTWWLAPNNDGSDPLTNDCAGPAIVYDPLADVYVVVFSHQEGSGSLVPHTIHAQRTLSYYDPDHVRYSYAFPIETDASNFSLHLYPDVTFSGVSDQMHVVYMSYQYRGLADYGYWIHDRTINGSDVGSRLELRYVTDRQLTDPAVAGSENGRCLVAWSEYDTSLEDWDVFGQRVAPYWIYLPAVLKNR